MRVFTLLLGFVLCATMAFAQKKVEKKKEVIIIKTENGKEMEAEVIKNLKEIEGMEDVDEIIKRALQGASDSTEVDIEVEETMENGVRIRKYVIKTIVDGKQEITEMVEEVNEGEKDGNSFTVDVTADIEEEIEMPSPTVSIGIMVAESTKIEEVNEGGAAEVAGLRRGDVILKLDQQIIYSIHGLLEHLTSYEAGDTAIVTFLRRGKERTRELTFKSK